MKKRIAFWSLGVLFLVVISTFYLLIYYIANPSNSNLALPPGSLPHEEQLLRGTMHSDFDVLSNHYRPQIYRSFCGVATSVTVLSALGFDITQESFFEKISDRNIRSFIKVFFTGMPLNDLADLLRAHGSTVDLEYASDSSMEIFRETVRQNVQDPSDFMLVNYSRKALNQIGGGHISPIGAYNPHNDSVLILDTANFKYPFHWVPLSDLFMAMDTHDGERTRGYITVSKL